MNEDVAGLACAAKKCPNGRKLICLYADKERLGAVIRKRRGVTGAPSQDVLFKQHRDTQKIRYKMEGWIE